ncbi:hypothetical protein L6R29_17755 [Myxococcota bacterium]|nr:hypothetical protein [Myxococcota bacterium]
MDQLDKYLLHIGKYFAVARRNMRDPRAEVTSALKKHLLDTATFKRSENVGWSLSEIVALNGFLEDIKMLPECYSYATFRRIERGAGGSMESIYTYAWILNTENELFSYPDISLK